MRKNAERILDEEPNDPILERDKTLRDSDRLKNLATFAAGANGMRQMIELMKKIDHTEALALNDELDRLTESFREKEEALSKAVQELEEFKSRLNTRAGSEIK